MPSLRFTITLSVSISLLVASRCGGGGATAFALEQQQQRAHNIKAAPSFDLPPISTFMDPQLRDCNAPLNGSRGEVVGSTGRIGSLLLRLGNGLLGAVPRGLSPGSLSPPGTPIFVCVHAAAIPNVIRTTLPNRREDLVLIANLIPSRLVPYDLMIDTEDLTLVVPHFGVLSVGGDVVTAPSSPPTIGHGRHVAAVVSLLTPLGINIEAANNIIDVEAAAIKKLIWSSLMWLLCHDESNGPINVAAVHEEKGNKLRSLVEEILPAAEALAGGKGTLGSVDDVMQYLEKYSMSMPNAIPSKELALSELSERNGLFLGVNDNILVEQEAILTRIAGPNILVCCKEPQNSTEHFLSESDRVVPHIACPSLAFISQDDSENSKIPENAIVVGGGMIGTSVALSLARRGVHVTVLDKRNIVKEEYVGDATTASWAWLNANDKVPWPYFSLNNMAMKVWRHDPLLRGLPVWSGSLVRRVRTGNSRSEHPGKGGAYCCIPLEQGQFSELESNAEFLGYGDNEEICFFPDEGQVDPVASVKALRKEASKLGVEFRGNSRVVDNLEDDSGRIQGVILEDGSHLTADIIIVAAGIGSSCEALGGLQILKQPGVIAFAKSRREGSTLSRILVDTINESHVLQRADGQLVMGGGFLQVGGIASASHLGNKVPEEDMAARELLEAASRVAPSAVEGATLSCTKQADRPIPKDGYPAVGFIRPGMYVIVTHSGITLGPLLAELAAIEICSQSRIELLERYRPSRFPSV